jgi:hypothetical protein
MKSKPKFSSLTLGLTLAALLPLTVIAQDRVAVETNERGGSALVTATATVKSVDLDKREVVIVKEDGKPVTLTVGPQVKRLSEIKPGDTVTAGYYVSVASDFREATDEEKANPLVELDTTVKSGTGPNPAGGAIRTYKVVGTIEAIDLAASSITLKGPKGNSHTVQVRDPDKLVNMEVGEGIVLTYTEAFAVQVMKGKPANKKE